MLRRLCYWTIGSLVVILLIAHFGATVPSATSTASSQARWTDDVPPVAVIRALVQAGARDCGQLWTKRDWTMTQHDWYIRCGTPGRWSYWYVNTRSTKAFGPFRNESDLP